MVPISISIYLYTYIYTYRYICISIYKYLYLDTSRHLYLSISISQYLCQEESACLTQFADCSDQPRVDFVHCGCSALGQDRFRLCVVPRLAKLQTQKGYPREKRRINLINERNQRLWSWLIYGSVSTWFWSIAFACASSRALQNYKHIEISEEGRIDKGRAKNGSDQRT